MTILAYQPAFSTGAVYEDPIAEHAAPLTWPGVSIVARHSLNQPQRSLEYLVRAMSGPSPFIAHVISLAWHLVNGLLLYLLLAPMVSPFAAVLATGLFWLHPLQSEAVAYVAGRPEVMAATWILLALLAAQRGWLWLAMVPTALAITGKEMAVTAWLLVPLFTCALSIAWTRAQAVTWAALTLIAAAGFLHGVAGGGVLHWAGVAYIGGQLAALGRLALLWPEALIHRSALTIDHDWRWVTKPIAALAVLIWAALLAQPWRPLRVAAAWTLIASLPRLLLPLLDGPHERHLYTASIGVCLALAVAVRT